MVPLRRAEAQRIENARHDSQQSFSARLDNLNAMVPLIAFVTPGSVVGSERAQRARHRAADRAWHARHRNYDRGRRWQATMDAAKAGAAVAVPPPPLAGVP